MSSKAHILMMGPLPARQMEQLEESFTLHKLWQSKDPEGLLHEVREQVQGLVSVFGVTVSAKLINALPNLEIIAHDSVGYDTIDIAAARERDIIVTNVAGTNAEDTADLAFAMLLALMRRVVEGDVYVRSGLWAKRGDLPLGRSQRGKTMGILGLGAIGQEIANRAQAFGMNIVYHGTKKKDGVPYEYFADLGDMAQACDVLMVSCIGGDKTRNLVDAKILKRLGKKGVLVNIARGSVVQEEDLIDALEGGVIAGAALDVFANEPDVPAALCRLDNVVLQPHQGSATVETRDSMNQRVVDNLQLYFEKAEVLTPV